MLSGCSWMLRTRSFWSKHVADSLAIAQFYPELTQRRIHMADIGCGAGFPALVLAAAFPNLLITAIDSTGKKINFVEKTAAELELKNLRAVHGRAIELNRQLEWHGRFELITARAVAPALNIYNETTRMLNRRGRWILYKTPEHATQDSEVMNAETAAIGIAWELSPEFVLPCDAGRRQFIASKRFIFAE